MYAFLLFFFYRVYTHKAIFDNVKYKSSPLFRSEIQFYFSSLTMKDCSVQLALEPWSRRPRRASDERHRLKSSRQTSAMLSPLHTVCITAERNVCTVGFFFFFWSSLHSQSRDRFSQRRSSQIGQTKTFTHCLSGPVVFFLQQHKSC